MRLRRLYLAGMMVALGVGISLWGRASTGAQGGPKAPTYRVDPFWPKPLPSVKDADGLVHQWVTGEVGASCIDSHDHIITVNRGFLRNGLLAQEGTKATPPMTSAPVRSSGGRST